MPTLNPTAATGARSAPAEMTYVDPARTMAPDEQAGFLEGTDLNGPFVADLLSDMLAHERAGARLYRSVAERTNNPVLQQRYRQFGNETERHVEILETLVTALGGDPGYVSPAARASERAGTALLESTFLLTGSVDLVTQELVMLDAVLLAEAKDHANWSCLAAMVEDLPSGEVREAFEDAVEEVEAQEDEHLTWAQDTRCRMISLQATSGPTTSLTMKAEEMVARIRNLFG
ncbi:MAG TPA: ferritin-like domain-containing protein [Acidimicrobiales bacterium]